MSGRALASIFRQACRGPAGLQPLTCMGRAAYLQAGDCKFKNDKGSWHSCANDFGSLTSSLRGFSTDTHRLQKPFSVEEAQEILKKIDAAHLSNMIKKESTHRWNMKYDDLVSLCSESGVSASKEEASQVCDALDKAGIVLRVKNLVYLRPLEVAEILYQALPDTDKEIMAKLNQLKTEAEPLLQQKAKIDSHAHRVSKAVLWTGLAVFTLQVVVYARLTFWELSWDVMEPVTYFTSASFAILAYIYCLWYNEEFGYQKAKSRIHSSIQNKKYAEKGLNKAKLDYLLDRINHLEQTLSPQHFNRKMKDRQGRDEDSDSGAFPAAATPAMKNSVPAAAT